MKKVYILSVVWLIACGAQAAVLAKYDITASGDVSPEPANPVDAPLTASNLTKVLGAGGGNGNGGWLFDGTNFDADGTDGGDNVATDAADRIFSFSVMADPGFTLSVDSFEWTVGVAVRNASRDAFHYTLVYVSDTSDFSNILAQSGTLGQDASTAPGGLNAAVGYYEKSFAFTGLNLTGYQTLYFAIEGSSNITNGNVDPVYRGLTINGAVVPEPSTLGVLGLSTIFMLLIRRPTRS